ncbi:MAG: thioredoxin 1 [Verrucomicrobiota bacterium]|nr:thioredoxin 1 [Verrucomicrobiota bacterium]MDK2964019.1 thioredoxin 1 [Verrucomicrobiota bacterium]
MKAIELTETTFNDTIRSGVTLVDFWAPWCGPCKMQIPILEKTAEAVGDRAVIAKLNVDEAPAVASQYGVRGIPTLILFKDGEEVNRFVGVQQEHALLSAIETTLSE